jgi:hypothetical protein
LCHPPAELNDPQEQKNQEGCQKGELNELRTFITVTKF